MSALGRRRRHHSKPTSTQVLRRDAYDVQSGRRSSGSDNLIQGAWHKARDSVKEDLVGQVNAGFIDLRGDSLCRYAALSIAGIGAIEHR